MRKILIFIIYFFIVIPLAFSGQRFQIEDDKGNILGTSSANPIHVTGNSGGTPGGSDTQVQYNSSGSFAGNSGFIYTGTNVGIGTAIPRQKLDVVGIGEFDSITLNGTGAGAVWSPNGLQFDGNNSTGTSLNPEITVLSGGNVGIGLGNTAPAAPLHVIGNAFFSNVGGNSITYDLNGSNFGAWYNTLTDSTLYYGASTGINVTPAVFPYILSLGTDSGNVGIGTAVAPTQLYVKGTTTTEGLKIPGNSVANGYVWTSTGTDGAAHWATGGGGGSGIVNSGTANQVAYYASSTTAVSGSSNIQLVGSNVGIGSASPGQLLDVKGTARMTGFILSTSPTSGYVLTTNSVGIGTWAPASGGGSSQWTTTNTNDVYLPSNGNVGLGTTLTTTAALTVMNGNVGIGTWIPGALLQVGGTGNVGIGTTNPGYSLDVNGGGRFLGSGNTLLAPTSGNIGIGTILPDGLLTVGGNCKGHSGTVSCWATNNGAAGYCSGSVSGTGCTCTAC